MSVSGHRQSTSSFASPPRRASHFARRTIRPVSSATTVTSRQSKTFEVPLFLSTTAPFQNMESNSPLPGSTRSRTSTRSIIDAVTLSSRFSRPQFLHASTRIQASAPAPSLPPPQQLQQPSQRVLSTMSLEDMVRHEESRRGKRSTNKRGKRYTSSLRKEAFKDRRVKTKAQLSLVFGVTLVAALVVCRYAMNLAMLTLTRSDLVLALTGIAGGSLFHIITILFILALTAVFCHCIIRMFMLLLDPDKYKRRRHPRHNVRQDQQPYGGPREWTSTQAEPMSEVLPKQPIQVFMASDEDTPYQADDTFDTHPPVIRPPPPTYGNFRSSTVCTPHPNVVDAKTDVWAEDEPGFYALAKESTNIAFDSDVR